MSLFEAGFNLPPGVTGSEPQIVGYPPCADCGHDAEDHDEEGSCTECDCAEYEQHGSEVEPEEDHYGHRGER